MAQAQGIDAAHPQVAAGGLGGYYHPAHIPQGAGLPAEIDESLFRSRRPEHSRPGGRRAIDRQAGKGGLFRGDGGIIIVLLPIVKGGPILILRVKIRFRRVGIGGGNGNGGGRGGRPRGRDGFPFRDFRGGGFPILYRSRGWGRRRNGGRGGYGGRRLFLRGRSGSWRFLLSRRSGCRAAVDGRHCAGQVAGDVQQHHIEDFVDDRRIRRFQVYLGVVGQGNGDFQHRAAHRSAGDDCDGNMLPNRPGVGKLALMPYKVCFRRRARERVRPGTAAISSTGASLMA